MGEGCHVPRHIAVGVGTDPARDQTQRHGALSRRQRGALGGFFEIQQTEIIFPSLAHHRFLRALHRIGPEMGDLLNDLPLEVAGIGGYPQPRSVLFRPQRGRRQIAQGLAGAGARFHQGDARRAGLLARTESKSGGIAVAGLFGAHFAHHAGQAGARLLRLHGMRAGVAHCSLVFPLRQAAPGLQAGDGRTVRDFPNKIPEQRRPAPAGARQSAHQRRQVGPHILGPGRYLLQQCAGDCVQALCGLFGTVRHRQAQGPRQPQRAGHKRQSRAHKGKQFQHIEQQRAGARAQPAADKRGMRHQHVAAFEQGARIPQVDTLGLAVTARNGCTRWSGHKSDQVGERFHGRGIMEGARRTSKLRDLHYPHPSQLVIV